MPAFNVDFMRNGGTYMILRGANGLHSRDINRVQHTMLASMEIPGLLPLDLREINFEVSLYYEITGRRMLPQCLKSDKLSAQEFYSLLLQIVAILDDCDQYMLSPLNFLIDEDFIFVEGPLASAMLYLTYVPIREPAGQERLGLSLLTLITRILNSVTAVEGDGIQRIVSFCGDELFSTATLKKILLDLLGGDRSEAVKMVAAKGNDRYESENSPVMIREYVQASEHSVEGKLQDRQRRIQKHVHSRAAKLEGSGEAHFQPHSIHNHQAEIWDLADNTELDDESEPIKPRGKFTYYLLGSLLAAALCWKFLYLDAPSSWGLYVCAGISLIMAVMLLLIRGGKLEVIMASLSEMMDHLSRRSSDEGEMTDDEAVNWKQPWNGGVWGGENSLHLPKPKSVISGQDAPETGGGERVGSWKQDAFRSKAVEVGELENELKVQANLPLVEESLHQPATVLLSHNSVSPKTASPTAAFRLERYAAQEEQWNAPEIIVLKPGSFVIGRSEEIAHYVEQAAGVSRAHVELMIREEGCSIKDLGSRNGTLLKGELIAPYKEYPLEPGDIFLIADSTYKLCAGHTAKAS
ncbi:DUF6382 domain-containing protein [Paenibacillus aceti]|uniref:FHA domain-containing protein n=1 Tax=Paenibacillus aceti TaxID=1820010 RepID=A0ABQ1W904_9BACL|nr:DUF6382 domain-containing protein [Paenibacillus aceti]GGG18837.1 hypothetical protein GCM10010913_46190 [Paenibacillus aceti]